MQSTPPTHRTNAMVLFSLFVLLLLFGISVRNSDDTCMAGAELGIDLTWWIGVNNFAAFLVVILAAYVGNKLLVAALVGMFFVPWHVIGFVLFTTTQKTCVTDTHAVGVVAVLIFVIDVCIVLLSVWMYFQPRPVESFDLTPNSSDKPWWKKQTLYLVFGVGITGVIIMSIGSSYMNDSCLTQDPTGINLAHWIVTMGTVTVAFVFIVALVSALARASRYCYKRYDGPTLARKTGDQAVVGVTSVWIVFLVVWVPLGFFIASSTQAGCISSSSSGQSALSAAFFLGLLLPAAALAIMNLYTSKVFTFTSN
jgi:hypothetical protein